jgi:hypothetical protein
MTLDSSNVQHEKLMIRLVDPVIPGFSISPAPAKPDQTDDVIKRENVLLKNPKSNDRAKRAKNNY